MSEERFPAKIPIPDGLQDTLNQMTYPERRRQVYVYVDGALLPLPGKDYALSDTCLSLTQETRPMAVITVSIPNRDERWYCRRGETWGRF